LLLKRRIYNKSKRKTTGCECPETRLGTGERKTLLDSPSKILPSSPCPCPEKPGKSSPGRSHTACYLNQYSFTAVCLVSLSAINTNKAEYIKSKLKGGGEADLGSGKWGGEGLTVKYVLQITSGNSTVAAVKHHQHFRQS